MALRDIAFRRCLTTGDITPHILGIVQGWRRRRIGRKGTVVMRTSRMGLAVAAAALSVIGPSMALADHNTLTLSPYFRSSSVARAKRFKPKRYVATKSSASITRKHRHNAARKAAYR